MLTATDVQNLDVPGAGPLSGAVDVYHFDEGTGTTTHDSVGANNGTLIGGGAIPGWVVPGKIGAAALSFSGNGTYEQALNSQSAVQLTSDLSPILGGTSSLDVWIKTTQVGNDTHWQAPAITGVEQTGGGNDINWGTLNGEGDIGIFVGDAGGVYSTQAVNDGQWHNIAMTRNATTGLVQLYVDGVLSGSGTFDVGNKTSQFFLLGALTDVAADGVTPVGANYFNGQIDEVRIYNQVLSASDVQGLATIPASPVINSATASPGPVVHLTWSTPSSFTQAIEVDRKTGAGGTYAAIATLGGGVTVYDDTSVTRGTQYFYVLKAIDLAGTSPPSNEVNVTPPIPTIVANSVLYNNSLYDGFNGSSNIPDTVAVATNKQALLPGQTATFQNITSYSRGINGVIIDVTNLDNLPRFEDFSFNVWDGVNPNGFVTAPAPSIINIYPGRGPNQSTQITIIWNDNVIQNEWLQVAILANAHTGLPTDDTFYFGNLIGATGVSDTASEAVVGPADFNAIVADPHGPLSKAGITSLTDINRDGLVNANDAIYARSNAGNTLPLITAPMPGTAAPGGEGQALAAPPGGGDQVVAAVSASSPSNSARSAPSESAPGSQSDSVPNSQSDSTPSTASTSASNVAAPAVNPTLPTHAANLPLETSANPSTPKTTMDHDQLGGASLGDVSLQHSLESSAVSAVWGTFDDANRQTTWWSGGGLTDTTMDTSNSLSQGSLDDGSLDDLLNILAFDRRRHHG